jgi:hypothetical protein
VFLALLAVGGCGTGTPPDGGGGAGGSAAGGSGGGQPSCAIKVGTGEDSFVPLAEGADVCITHGSQGGYHIWGAFLARGFVDKQLLLLDYDLEFEDGTPYKHTQWCINPLKDAPLRAGWREKAGLFGYLPFDADPAVDLAGKKLRLHMRLRDGVARDSSTGSCSASGEPTCTAEASVLVTPSMDPTLCP